MSRGTPPISSSKESQNAKEALQRQQSFARFSSNRNLSALGALPAKKDRAPLNSSNAPDSPEQKSNQRHEHKAPVTLPHYPLKEDVPPVPIPFTLKDILQSTPESNLNRSYPLIELTPDASYPFSFLIKEEGFFLLNKKNLSYIEGFDELLSKINQGMTLVKYIKNEKVAEIPSSGFSDQPIYYPFVVGFPHGMLPLTLPDRGGHRHLLVTLKKKDTEPYFDIGIPSALPCSPFQRYILSNLKQAILKGDIPAQCKDNHPFHQKGFFCNFLDFRTKKICYYLQKEPDREGEQTTYAPLIPGIPGDLFQLSNPDNNGYQHLVITFQKKKHRPYIDIELQLNPGMDPTPYKEIISKVGSQIRNGIFPAYNGSLKEMFNPLYQKQRPLQGSSSESRLPTAQQAVAAPISSRSAPSSPSVPAAPERDVFPASPAAVEPSSSSWARRYFDENGNPKKSQEEAMR